MPDDAPVQASVTAPTAFFTRTYDEAIALVHEARDYLAHQGAKDAHDLPMDVSACYSVETMRLTARLTNVMAWLLVQRAAHAGELSWEELRQDTWRLGGKEVCLAPPTTDPEQFPPALTGLLARSEALFQRIARLDEMVAREAG